MTPALIAFVKQVEGFRATPYLCPAGKPSIGYGTVIPSLAHQPINESTATAWLLRDLTSAEAQVRKLVPRIMTLDQLAALTDFVYNLGYERLEESTMRQCAIAGDWPGAARQCRRWIYGGGKVLPGLVTRRMQEARWMLAESTLTVAKAA